MPGNNEVKQGCIICGDESDTTVCLRCFFNYDYRTYNKRELEQTQNPDGKIDLNDLPLWDKNDTAGPYHASHEDDSDKKLPFSWISRLPRFS